MMPHPGDDDRDGDDERRDRVERGLARSTSTRTSPTSTPNEVSASAPQVRRVALERRRVVLAGLPAEVPGDADVGDGREARSPRCRSRAISTSAPIDEPPRRPRR